MIYNILSAEFYTIVYRFYVKKHYWGRYQIVQAKSNLYQYYGIDEISKDKQINMKKEKDEMGK